MKSYALTTASRVADYMGVTLNATQETVMENIIDIITGMVEGYCGRRFQETAYTNEIYDGEGAEAFLLENWPVNSDETFTLQMRESTENEDDWETIDTEEYFIDYENGVIYGASRRKFKYFRKGYRVTYTAGYDFDNAATFLGDTLAGDVEFATWLLASSYWARRTGDIGIVSESLGDYSVRYGRSSGGGTGGGGTGGMMIWGNNDVQSILDRYKRTEVVSVLTPRNST